MFALGFRLITFTTLILVMADHQSMQDDSGLREACGVFGCVSQGEWPTQLDVAHTIYLGLVGLQHRYVYIHSTIFPLPTSLYISRLYLFRTHIPNRSTCLDPWLTLFLKDCFKNFHLMANMENFLSINLRI
jgi:hypothetical protein